jgi:hypothetical protein
MKAYLYSNPPIPRRKRSGVMNASIHRVMATSTQEVEISIYCNTSPKVMNLRLSLDEAKELANDLNRVLAETPSVV